MTQPYDMAMMAGMYTDGAEGEAAPPPAEAAPVAATTTIADLGGDEDEKEHPEFTCTVCQKVFKREMNLVFHMTTHRPKKPKPEGETEPQEPVACEECGKTFGTKYQAKKHYLRKHFKGERPFGCEKCGKRFVVKEDHKLHVKSCGYVYACTCGIRLCSLGALKQHCKHFGHEPASLEPQIQMTNGMLQLLPQGQAGLASAAQFGLMRPPYSGQPLLGAAGLDPAALAAYGCFSAVPLGAGLPGVGGAAAPSQSASCALNLMAGAAALSQSGTGQMQQR